MAAGYIHRCDNCGYVIKTSGPYEFYRDKDGKRKPYGHPIPASEEAEKYGICGWYAMIYCVSCNEVAEIITDEYENPLPKTEFWSGWLEHPEQMHAVFAKRLELEEQRKKAKEGGGKIVVCPKCSSFDLVLGPRDEELICPVCKSEVMKGEMEWIS